MSSLQTPTKASLADAAKVIAASYELIQHGRATYMPADFETMEHGPCDLPRRIWVPFDRDEKRRHGQTEHNFLFASDAEISSFDLMISQCAAEVREPSSSLLIKTKDGLKLLQQDGSLEDPDGSFHANYIRFALNEDPADKAEMMAILVNWLGDEGEVESLLTHLATALNPAQSAVKYVLLIGEGRNGKSVLLGMLRKLFGSENISSVTRQQMAERSPSLIDLNDKLLNIVNDGEMNWIKDSSMEKTLIAGEPAPIRLLYVSGNVLVQTKALFIEALNKEPKSKDKSSALQKRISRFVFTKIFPLDKAFEKKMMSDRMLGALLSLLIDHMVHPDEYAEKLKPTQKGMILQVEMNLQNSPVHRFISWEVAKNPGFLCDLQTPKKVTVEAIVEAFMGWKVRDSNKDLNEDDVRSLIKDSFYLAWKTRRVGGKIQNVQVLNGPRPEIELLLDHMASTEPTEEEVEEDEQELLVAD